MSQTFDTPDSDVNDDVSLHCETFNDKIRADSRFNVRSRLRRKYTLVLWDVVEDDDSYLNECAAGIQDQGGRILQTHMSAMSGGNAGNLAVLIEYDIEEREDSDG